LSLLLAAAFRLGWLPSEVVYLRADLGTLAGLAGLLLAFGVGMGWLWWSRAEGKQRAFHNRIQVEATNERRGFLRRLDHELKNPLMAIRAGLANLGGTAVAPDQQDVLAGLEIQTARLSNLLSDLRKLSELETRPLDRSPVDIGNLLQEVVTETEKRPEAAGRHISFILPQAPWPLPAVPGDRDLLFLMFHNLADNALKFTLPGNTIELRAFEDNPSVVVEVADTGQGIPDRDMPMVWEELFRGENARGTPGSGLGLALVRAIAERHRGQVFLRSRVGQGTVITLRLPIR
jgi:two-component system OmpR family sensor kinase